jgi:dTDP-glucose 4,6-dehydratase
MIEMSGREVEIVFTGLREGEKLHEDLRSKTEQDFRPKHSLISHAHVPGLRSADLDWRRWQEVWAIEVSLPIRHSGNSR